jgi:hypothetical protein
LRWQISADDDPELAPGVDPGGTEGSNFRLTSFNNTISVSHDNFSSFRSGRSCFGNSADAYNAQLGVQNNIPNEDSLVVWGCTGQTGYLQVWKNFTGAAMASLDVNGILTVNGLIGGPTPPPGLSLDASKRLEIGVPAAAGHPLGTLHIGPDTAFAGGLHACSIAIEAATGLDPAALPAGMGRLFFYNNKFVIEFSSGGTRWYTYLALTPGIAPAPPWQTSLSP